MTTLEEAATHNLERLLDETQAPHNRAAAWKVLRADMEYLGDVIAHAMLHDGNTMRQVAQWTGVPLTTAQRQWGWMNPRSR